MPAYTTETVARTQCKTATINQRACPSYSLHVQLLCYSMYYPGGMKCSTMIIFAYYHFLNSFSIIAGFSNSWSNELRASYEYEANGGYGE